jgi:hypothetical protein
MNILWSFVSCKLEFHALFSMSHFILGLRLGVALADEENSDSWQGGHTIG